MNKMIRIERKEDIVVMADRVVYSQKPYWCGCDMRQLSLSILHPRMYYDYDVRRKYPLLVFFCGGGFLKMQRNVWIPELVYYAKHGYIVASVDYSVLPISSFPENIIDAKAAIRFLKAHADEYGIDASKVAVMGESAGGYIAAFLGLTSGTGIYDQGENLDVSSDVQAVIADYPVVNAAELSPDKSREDLIGYPELCSLVDGNAAPMCILHGTKDDQVPCEQSRQLYEALEKHGVNAWLTLIEDANHGDGIFVQEEVKELILKFLQKEL